VGESKLPKVRPYKNPTIVTIKMWMYVIISFLSTFLVWDYMYLPVVLHITLYCSFILFISFCTIKIAPTIRKQESQQITAFPHTKYLWIILYSVKSFFGESSPKISSEILLPPTLLEFWSGSVILKRVSISSALLRIQVLISD
jgi:hypothetical protein